MFIHGEAHCSCTRTHTPTYKCTPTQLSHLHTRAHAHTRLHAQTPHISHAYLWILHCARAHAKHTNTGWLRDCLAKARCFVKQGSSKRPKTNGSKCYRCLCVCCRQNFIKQDPWVHILYDSNPIHHWPMGRAAAERDASARPLHRTNDLRSSNRVGYPILLQYPILLIILP